MWGRGIHTRCKGGIWDVGRGLGGRSASLALRTPGRVWLSICPVVRASALGVGVGELGLTSSEPLYLPVSSKHTHTHTHRILTNIFVTYAIIIYTCFSDG